MTANQIPMRELLVPQAVAINLESTTKKDALMELAKRAAVISHQDSHKIFDVMWEREKLGSTGVGLGIAIPHGRIEGLEKVQGFFARLSAPIPFEAIDEQPVDLIFLLLAPASAGADHLHALATVSRLLRDKKLCDQIRKAKDEAAIYRLLTETPTAQAA